MKGRISKKLGTILKAPDRQQLARKTRKPAPVPETLWDEAILDAKEKIRAYRYRIQQLKVAIEVFQERKAAGEPFPGQENSREGSRREEGNNAV